VDEAARYQAVHDVEHDLCLSAGAGSGKTTVLIQRIVHLLTAGVAEPQEIVAITFTEKAAAELKGRLAAALRQQGREHPPERAIWQERVNALERAYLGTIHSFCGALLREHPLEADVDPYFAVLDEVDGEALRRKVRGAWLEEALERARQGQGPLATLLQYVDLSTAETMIETLLADPLREEGVRKYYEAMAGDGPRSPDHGEAIPSPSPFSFPPEEPRHRAAREALWQAVAEVRQRFEQAKRERGRLSFDDLVRRARDLLRHCPTVRARYQRQFRYVHVDEFQDVDRWQAELIGLLCGFEGSEVERPPRLFIVGDRQQSIYRFRGAEVDQFRRMEEAILCRGGVSLQLTRCFRSHWQLLDFFNQTFAALLVPPEGLPEESSIRYTAMQAVRPSPGEAPAVEFLFRPLSAPALQARTEEAQALARRLREMRDQGEPIFDPVEGHRPVEWRDMALLFRAMTDVKIYEQALREQGIPCYTLAGSGFFDRPEIGDMVQVLRLLVHPHDRLARAAVLRSPWVGCADSTLYWIAAEEAWEELEAPRLRKHLSDEEGARLDHFSRWFGLLRARRDRVPLSELLQELWEATGYRVAIMAWPDGRQAWANLHKLLDLARRSEVAGGLTVADFLAHLQQRMEYTPREAEAALELEAGQTVKLLSIHRAKGLEWPVVAVPDLDRPLNLPTESFLADPAEGVGMKLLNERLQLEAGPDYGRVQAALIRREIAESQRVFYVACTRARDRLLLSARYDPATLKPQRAGDRSWLQWLAAVFDWEKDSADVEERQGSGRGFLLHLL